MAEPSMRAETWSEVKKALSVWRAVITSAFKAIRKWLVPSAYPNGMPVGDLRILVTYEDDESWSPGKVLDAAAGWGGTQVAQVTVLDSDGACVAQRRLRGRQSGKKVRERLAAELDALGVRNGAPPPEDLQARLDRI
jgi:hypothetical protein